MNKYELEKTVAELNELAWMPWYEERCLELAKALTEHYLWKDKQKEDKNQLKLQFKEE